MNISRKRIYIGGMTCVNCQNKIEQALKKTPGVESVKICYHKKTADIALDLEWVTWEEIQTVIRNLGYEILQEPEVEGSGFGRTAFFLILIFSLYRMLQHSGILNLLVPSELADDKMGYGMLFLIGILTSVHCVAMCGGINLSQCIPKSTGNKIFRPAVLYNLGRVISYTGIGFILGLAGMLFQETSGVGISPFFQGMIKIIAGIFMVIMGINMLGIFPWLRHLQLQLPRFLVRNVNKKKTGCSQPFVIGLLNGLMPCGPLQSMQIVALASGNPFAGALSMLAFSLGTVPLMLGLGSFVAMLGKRFSARVMEIGAVLVVVLGLAMLSQGGNLSGLFYSGMSWDTAGKQQTYAASVENETKVQETAPNTNGSGTNDSGATVEDRVQVIESTLTGGRYPNITVTAGIPVRWIIHVPKGALNGCNYRMQINVYGIVHTFSEGENIIEFIPEQTGTIPYTCWMGMIRGTIFVTDGTGETQEASDGQTDINGSGGFGMGCCGGG